MIRLQQYPAPAVLAMLALCLTAGAAWAQPVPPQQPAVAEPPEPADQLVRRVVQAGLEANRNGGRYMFLLHREDTKGSRTQEIVETRDGLVSRLLAVNGKPLTPEQRRRDDEKLARLVSDPAVQRERRKEQKEDEERILRLVRSLPDAFHYSYDGTEPGPHGQMLRLKFVPNPDFKPPSREANVFRGMEGAMWVDASSERLVRIDATLVDKVNFGWGILGHLDRGGRFVVEQNPIGGGRWEMTRLRLNITGKIFFFKSLKVDMEQRASNFRRVPDNLSLADGVALLQKQGSAIAEKAMLQD